MPEVAEHAISCPYCGEAISILVDDSVPEQEYVEDCQVCCRPIVVSVGMFDGKDLLADVRREDDA